MELRLSELTHRYGMKLRGSVSMKLNNYINGSVQDCGNSIANLPSYRKCYTKPRI